MRAGPRVILVDPSPRGGIALYTSQLAKALRAAGVSAEILGSRKLGISTPEEIPVSRLLPSDRWGRPKHAGLRFFFRRAITWFRSARTVERFVRRRKPDVVHFQAQINRRFDGRLLRRIARSLPVVWTAHDVLPFERTTRDEEWFAAIYRAVDAVVVHTSVAKEEVRSLAGVEATVIEHLSPTDGTESSRAEARRQLGLPAFERVFAALGFIRPYKGYGLLADVWERLGKHAPLLLVMGDLLEESERPVVERLERTGRADVRLGYASDDELQLAISASDALLLPYASASESGLLHLALARGVPVIASDAPQLAEAVREHSAGVIVARHAKAWSAAVTGELPPPPPAPPQLSEVGDRHRRLYERVLEARTPPLRSFRLVLYTDATTRGGAEQVLADLAGALDPMIDITVMGVDEKVVNWVAGHRKAATTCLVPPVRDKRDLRPVLAHWRALRALRPAVFHANLRIPWACQYGIAAALLVRGTKVVAVEHLPTPPTATLQRVLKRLTSRRLDAHVAVGDRTARELEAMIGLPDTSIRTIHNGVHWDEPASPVRPFAGRTIAAVGRLDEQKRFDLVLRALAGLADVSVVVVGDGPERKSLERLCDQLGLLDRVCFLGWVDDPAHVLGGVDALVLSSGYEAFPLVILEAMHAGLPVVATDVGSVREAVVSSETGIIVPPNDVNALTDAIREVLDPAVAHRLGERARAIARRSFTAEEMARDYEFLYRRLLS
jgi:glycosyltransferase involved in cell wall biosynthesis